MSPRRLLYAAEFALRLLAVFLPRHRWRIRRISYAVRGYGGLLVTAIAIHQAQIAHHHGRYHMHHHAIYQRRPYDTPTAYRYPHRSNGWRSPTYPRYPGYPGYASYSRYARRRPHYRAPDPCPWAAYYPYRPCASDPLR